MVNKLFYESEEIGNVHLTNTFAKRFMGYMFQNQPHHDTLLFQPCDSIHTFFMKFNIDVLFMDGNMKILKKIENLSPRKIVLPVKGCKIVVEGKAGIFKNCEVGGLISLSK
ncbi:DUF192 domain-containing protein [Alkalicella caledoniensis]|uniref:DUF192 domain-containing protein n=1 Tax=Alkalicella caledoniensis TaxID=2731377 RepID=A0A7G9W7D4_ALKCA|nr:DUF192 domain-containing protein [Alkalicella caledoniensis]QNO14596.1 DUF192 domain-containing protein [Alkalicella caledoniensis]